MIGEALAAACSDLLVLARLGGELGEAARAAHARLAQQEPGARPEARRALRARWAAASRAPVPPGLRGVHPTWIEAALAELPPRARTDLARGGAGAGANAGVNAGAAVEPGAHAHPGAADRPAGADPRGGAVAWADSKVRGGAVDPVAVWLTRWACAGLPPMPAADAAGPPTSIDHAVRLRAGELAAWLAEVGADQLALALGAAGPARGEALAAAARVVGDPLLRAATRIAAPPRAGALGSTRAALARCRVPLDNRALLVIGARAIAPHTGPLSRRQLAARLPRPLGLAAADALTAFARSPADHAPSWQALSAAW